MQVSIWKKISGLSFLLLLALLVSCGSDSKSGGSKSQNPYGIIPPNTPGLNQTSQQAVQSLNTWYSSTTQGPIFTANRVMLETRKITIYNQNSGCNNNKAITVFGINLGNFSFCNMSQSPASSNNSQRSVTPAQNGQAKSGNSALAAVFSGSYGTIVNASSSNQNGGYAIYVLNFNKANGHQVMVVIDTAVNSAFNPVFISDSEFRREEILTQVQ